MAHIISDGLQACDDCTIAIANDDYSGMDADTAETVRSGITLWSKQGYLVIGEELGFSHHGCDICDSNLAGNAHSVTLLGD